MGGNAIKKVRVDRLEKVAYDHVSQGMFDTLKTAFPDATVHVIPAYKNKDSFGDLDVLISGVESEKLQEFCQLALRTEEMHVNGNVISFALEMTAYFMKKSYFQVDFIIVPEETHDFALNYFSYNDLGNFIGQTARGIGLKFGHNGLFYKYIVGTQLIREIYITTDFSEALKILCYDSEEYSKGFDDLEDVFKYASTSLYFSTWNYELENRNAVSRVRDRKRKTYIEFTEWFKEKGFNRYKIDSNIGLELALKNPEFCLEYAKATAEYHRVNRVKEKFNGAAIQALTGYTGKDLGEFMQEYREKFGSIDTFFRKVDNMKSDELAEDIASFDEKLKTRG
jgi:hypothetical protein